MERVHRDHADEPASAEPIHRMRGIHRPERFQQRIERPRLPKDLLHADCAHEGRQDHGHKDQRAQQRLAGKNKSVAQEGERERDQRGERRAASPHEQRVPEAFQVDRIAKDLGRIIERRLSIRPDKSPAKGLDNRPHKEHRKEGGSEEEDNFGEGVGHELFLPRRRRGAKGFTIGIVF